MKETRLGTMLRLYRASNRLGIRETAKSIGVSAATLSRVERGRGFDGATYTKLLVWMTATP